MLEKFSFAPARALRRGEVPRSTYAIGDEVVVRDRWCHLPGYDIVVRLTEVGEGLKGVVCRASRQAAQGAREFAVGTEHEFSSDRVWQHRPLEQR